MKTLIAEDDFTSRLLLQEFMQPYGPPHIAVSGTEALEAVRAALEAGKPYDLMCLDIMMPEMDGQRALEEIRLMEKEKEIAGADRMKIIMTTSLGDRSNVITAVQHQCDSFLIKPVDRAKLLDELRKLKLIR